MSYLLYLIPVAEAAFFGWWLWRIYRMGRL